MLIYIQEIYKSNQYLI